MPNSIYMQMAGALRQMTKYDETEILYRGKVLACVVLWGDTSETLGQGGLQTKAAAHVKVLRSIIEKAFGQGGEIHSNELVTAPATAEHGLQPAQYMVKDVIPERFAFSFGLVDPSE